MILRRYFARLFLGRALAVLFALAALLELLELLDRTSEVLARGGPTDVLRYAALRLPTVLGQLVPLAVLVGAILTFWRLAATLEMAATRAAGVGAWRILGALAPACALAVAAQLALLHGVAPRTERALADWWDRSRAGEEDLGALPRRLWLRSEGDIVAVDAVSLDGGRLGGVLLIRRDAEDRALEHVDARRAEYGPEGWRLEGVRIVRPGEARAAAIAELAWPGGPAPRAMRDLARPIEAQTFGRLLADLRGEGALARGPAFYATRAHAAAAHAAVPFVMLLLAAPAAFGLPRHGGSTRCAATGLVLGLGLLVAGGLLTALGEAGVLHPAIAAWTAPLCFATTGALILAREEA